LLLLALFASIRSVNTKHSKTLKAIFAKPTPSSLVFAHIEALVLSLGGQVFEREGSRVKVVDGRANALPPPASGQRSQALPSGRSARIV
jgi:hypothetical protein